MKKAQLKVEGVQFFEFENFKDDRGELTVGNFETEIPFIAARYFLIYGVSENKIRGEHAHKECHQFLVCTNGSCLVTVDDGKVRQDIFLDKPNKGLYLPPKIWGVQKQSADACLLVFASHPYDNDDYIRDYKEFKKLVSID